MRKVYLIALFILTILIQTKAQNNPVCNCYCNYASHYKIEKYIFKADSIASKLKKQYNQNIKVIGSRGYAAATLVFIVKVNGRNKGFNYDLTNKKKEIVEGPKLDRWLKDIITDSAFLHTVNRILINLPMIGVFLYPLIIRIADSQKYVIHNYQLI